MRTFSYMCFGIGCLTLATEIIGSLVFGLRKEPEVNAVILLRSICYLMAALCAHLYCNHRGKT